MSLPTYGKYDARCVTCGVAIGPERAQRYAYCTKPACRKQNARGLTIVAAAVNKAADDLHLLDAATRRGLADGSYARQLAQGKPALPDRPVPARRTGTAPADWRSPAPGRQQARPGSTGSRAATPRAARPPAASARSAEPSAPTTRSWSRAQQDLAAVWNAQGIRPDEVARRLGVSVATATRMILAARESARR